MAYFIKGRIFKNINSKTTTEPVMEFNTKILSADGEIIITIPPKSGKHSPYRLKIKIGENNFEYIFLPNYYEANRDFPE